MNGDMPTWAVVARMAGAMKAQVAEKREEWLFNKNKVDAAEERALREAFVAWDDAAFRVSLEARRQWWRAEEARMRAGRRWNR